MEDFKNIIDSNLLKSEILGRVLFPSSVINDKVSELGNRITEDYLGKDLVLVSVLRGGVIFVTDLARKIDIDLTIDFISISSYHGINQPSTGIVKINKDLEDSIEGRDVIIVEDIIDTGLTISYLLRNLKSRSPSSIEICTLLNRDVRRIANVNIKYAGFSIGDEYVVGYGLDYKQKYRNLDSIYELRTDMVKKDIENIQNKPIKS
jgi:hypoxanthine phosphoribosyltransferase